MKSTSHRWQLLNYDFRGGLQRIFRASSADLPRCRRNCIFWIGGHPVATRWPATCGGHMWGHMWDHMWARTLYMLPANAVVSFISHAVWRSDLLHQSWCPLRCAFRSMTSAGVFRGSSADLRGAGRMTNQESLIHQRLVSSTVCSSTHDFGVGLPRIFRGSSAVQAK